TPPTIIGRALPSSALIRTTTGTCPSTSRMRASRASNATTRSSPRSPAPSREPKRRRDAVGSGCGDREPEGTMEERAAFGGVSRRRFLRGAGAFVAAGAVARRAAAYPAIFFPVATTGTPPVEQAHLTFGADPAHAMVVSWVSPVSVAAPQVRLGTPSGG